MSTLKLIHGADLHLDSPFSGLPPEQAAQRRREQRELLSRLASLARERQADLVLLSGDLLDSRQTYRETAQALVEALAAIPCPVFLAPGNHDAYGPKSLYAALDYPENVHLFQTAQLQGVELPGLQCVVYGCAFRASHREDSPLAGFSAAQAPEGWTKLGVLHGDVEGSGGYAPISRQEIAESGLDYLALGHVHQYSGLQREGNTFWAYPGCPEGRGFDETGDKGVLCLEVGPGECRGELVPLCRRRYWVLQADVTGQDPLEAAQAVLTPERREDICRVIFTGERGEAPLDLDALAARLEGRCWALTLRDGTRVRRDVWARMGEDGLTGLFLQAMAARIQRSPDDPVLQQAAAFGMAALEHGEDVAP